MGFYGNITNTARTQFQFDRVYPNRYEMEQKTKVDGIYAGRYILIEYDSNTHLDCMTRVWIKDNKFYTQDAKGARILLKQGNISIGEMVYTVSAEIDRVDPRDYKDCVFYKCISFDNETIAQFEEVVDGVEAPAYTVNYNIDTDVFGAGRGYDSTVWQKTYTAEAGEKYVMIAELNTVVPTFAVTPDAPTMNPVVPHFDQQSTDVYYKLHWQAPWGFRVKETTADKSDELTAHTTTTYDPSTGKNTVVTEDDVIAAIYFNEAAFDAQVDAARTSEAGINKHATNGLINEIKVEPTGKSGNKYNDHEGAFTQSEQVDIQEMTINLPAIGNMMSDAWDIIHGPLRNNDMRQVDGNGKRVDSLQGRLDSIAAINVDEIPVKRDSDGKLIGSKINGGRNSDQDNDLTGVQDDAWIETIVDSNNKKISIHHTFNQTKNGNTFTDLRVDKDHTHDTVDSINMNEEEGDSFNIVTPIVDAMGHVVGKNAQTITLPHGVYMMHTDGVSTNTSDIYTEFVNDDTMEPEEWHSKVEDVNPSFVTADNSKDTFTLNPYNKWIQIQMPEENEILGSENNAIKIAHEIHYINELDKEATDLNIPATDTITLQDIVFDTAGHVKENRNHTYTLPYGFKTIKTNGRSDEVSENATGTPVTANIVAENTQDTLTIDSGNKWIRIDTDATGDSLTIRHDVHNFDADKTDSTSLSNETSQTVTFDTTTYAFDKAGHFTGKTIKTITMPFGYGKIKGDSGNTAATATYDELTFASDEWLTATVAKDKVTYSHDYPKKVDDTTSTFDVNDNGDTIVLETLERDDKGHVIKVNQNTVTLPYGYKTFTGDSGISSANSTQDTMSVTGDNWIQTTVTNDSITFAHIGPVTGTATEVGAKTPAFGATFTIDDHYFDDKGHKFTSKSHTVKIPQPSLTNGTGNVVTGLGLTPSSGAFVETKANLGTIKLGSYEGGDSAADLSADITLQQALSRLQNKIANEAAARQNAIAGLDVTDTAVEGQYVTAVNEQDGKITVSRKNLPTYAMSDGTEDGTVIFNDVPIKVGGFANLVELVAQLSTEVSTLRSEVNRLNDIVAQAHPELIIPETGDNEVGNV